ncbi:RfaG Glycosyltransferase [Methylophilaceae bacterium]
MKILIVSQYFWPENFKINDIVFDLSERGHQITVLTGLPNYPEGKVYKCFKDNPDDFKQYANAKIIRVPMVPRGDNSIQLVLNYFSFALSATLFGAYRLRKQDFDVIFVFEPSPVTVGIPASFLRWIKKSPVVFWVQDLWPESLQAVGAIRSKVILSIIAGLVRYIYKHCDLILAQSKSFIPQIKKYTDNHTQVIYMPNWAESIFDLSDVVHAKEVPIKQGSFDVMFAGNIGEAQDFPSILSAAELVKSYTNIRWLIVGDGRMADWVANEIEIRNLQDSVLMLGRYPGDRMPSFFKHAKVLLVSLKDELIFSMTIPGKIQSYLAAGRPVLAMLNGEGANIINESEAGITCPAEDAQALADSVLKLSIMSACELEEMGRKGLDYSNREFNRRILIEKLVRMLEQTQITKSDRKANGV